MAKSNNITTKEIAELVLKLQGKPNKKSSIDYLIKEAQKTIHDNEEVKGHTGIKNQRLYNLKEATIIINTLTKTRKNIETKKPIQSLSETKLYEHLLSSNHNYDEDPQALAVNAIITKKVANLLKEKKIEFYLAGIASQRVYELNTKKLQKDIEKYYIFQEIEADNYDEKPQKITKLEHNLNDYQYYQY